MARAIFYMVFITPLIIHVKWTNAKGPRLGSLQCYECETLTDLNRCQQLDVNNSRIMNCPAGYTYCMARRISYMMNTTKLKLWYMERNCSASCQEYCIVVGERIRITECTSCCTKDLCNTGSGCYAVIPNLLLLFSVHFIRSFLCYV